MQCNVCDHDACATYSISLWEGDVGLNSNSQDVLETIDNGVRNGGLGAVTNLQRHTSHVGKSSLELGDELIISNIQDRGREDGAVIVDILNNQTISEGLNIQHLEESSLGLADLITFVDQVDVGLK